MLPVRLLKKATSLTAMVVPPPPPPLQELETPLLRDLEALGAETHVVPRRRTGLSPA